MMPINSLLFVAVLFVTSSTRSLSASVGRLRSSKENAATYPMEMETITEERTFDSSAIDKMIQGVKMMTPSAKEQLMYLNLVLRRVNGIKAYELLKLHNDNNIQSHNIRLKIWAMYLQRSPKMTIKATTKELTRLGDERVVQMIDAFEMANVDKQILGNFKHALMRYWKNQEKSSLDVLKLLKLDNMGSQYNPIELERFKMWIKFTKEEYAYPIVEICGEFPVDVRVRILDGFRQIDDTPNVNKMENALVQSLSHRDINKYGYSNAFKDLKLDEGLEKLLDHRNLAIFYGYAVKAFPRSSEATALIVPSRECYGDELLGKMLDAAVKKKVPDAETLLNELFRKWNRDADIEAIVIDQVAKGDVKMAYDAYVPEPKKPKNA